MRLLCAPLSVVMLISLGCKPEAPPASPPPAAPTPPAVGADDLAAHRASFGAPRTRVIAVDGPIDTPDFAARLKRLSTALQAALGAGGAVESIVGESVIGASPDRLQVDAAAPPLARWAARARYRGWLVAPSGQTAFLRISVDLPAPPAWTATLKTLCEEATAPGFGVRLLPASKAGPPFRELDLLVRPGAGDAVDLPALLALTAAVRAALGPDSAVRSFADALLETNGAIGGSSPPSPEQLSQLVLLTESAEPALLTRYCSLDMSTCRVQIRLAERPNAERPNAERPNAERWTEVVSLLSRAAAKAAPALRTGLVAPGWSQAL